MEQVRSNIRSWDEARRALAHLNRLVPTDWAPYTVAWTSSGFTPTVGDGSLNGWFTRTAVWCFAQIAMQLGTGNNASGCTSTWYFSLPADLEVGSDLIVNGGGFCLDGSAPQYHAAVPEVVSATPDKVFVRSGTGLALASVPFAWATNDRLHLTIGYPVGIGN